MTLYQIAGVIVLVGLVGLMVMSTLVVGTGSPDPRTRLGRTLAAIGAASLGTIAIGICFMIWSWGAC